MNHFDDFDTLLDVLAELKFGRLEDVTLDIPDDDPALAEYSRIDADVQKPIRQFSLFVKGKGHLVFLVLKVQNGLPMFGEVEVQPGRIKSLKFA